MLESNRTLAGHSLVTNATQNDSGYRDIEEEIESSVCRRETSLLFVLLMLGTRKSSLMMIITIIIIGISIKEASTI